MSLQASRDGPLPRPSLTSIELCPPPAPGDMSRPLSSPVDAAGAQAGAGGAGLERGDRMCARQQAGPEEGKQRQGGLPGWGRVGGGVLFTLSWGPGPKEWGWSQSWEEALTIILVAFYWGHLCLALHWAHYITTSYSITLAKRVRSPILQVWKRRLRGCVTSPHSWSPLLTAVSSRATR